MLSFITGAPVPNRGFNFSKPVEKPREVVIDMRMFRKKRSSGGRRPSVGGGGGDALLLEGGDYLLTEDGDRILLEA